METQVSLPPERSVEKLSRIHRAWLDFEISRMDWRFRTQLDAILHSPHFQAIEAAWRGLAFLVDHTDFRQNVCIELLDVSKEALQQDFDDTPDIIESGLYRHMYIQEYDRPGGEPIGAMIGNYVFNASAKDIVLLRDISKVAAASHAPFIGSVGPSFFDKETMAEVVEIQDLGDYLDRPQYSRWRSFRETDDARYIGLTLPRVLGRLPYGSSDSSALCHFSYEEMVKGVDASRYLWINAAFAFAVNMVRSFKKNGWCLQIRGPHAGGKIEYLPVHSHDIGTHFQPKINAEILIPETREFEFAKLGFIAVSFYRTHDFACFFSANSAHRPADYDTNEATTNSRINGRLPYIFLMSRIAHYLKLIQRENIGTTKDRWLLEVELNNWIRNLVTEMTDPTNDFQASHPLRQAKVEVEDIDDNPGFFRIKLFVQPHFRVEGLDVSLSLVSQMPKAKD